MKNILKYLCNVFTTSIVGLMVAVILYIISHTLVEIDPFTRGMIVGTAMSLTPIPYSK